MGKQERLIKKTLEEYDCQTRIVIAGSGHIKAYFSHPDHNQEFGPMVFSSTTANELHPKYIIANARKKLRELGLPIDIFESRFEQKEIERFERENRPKKQMDPHRKAWKLQQSLARAKRNHGQK